MHLIWVSSSSSDSGTTAPILRGRAFFDAKSHINHFQFFSDSDVVALVGDHVDQRPAGALLGSVHQLFQFLLAGLPSDPLYGKLLAIEELISTGIGEHRERALECEVHAAKIVGRSNATNDETRMGHSQNRADDCRKPPPTGASRHVVGEKNSAFLRRRTRQIGPGKLGQCRWPGSPNSDILAGKLGQVGSKQLARDAAEQVRAGHQRRDCPNAWPRRAAASETPPSRRSF
jgi:hypothetical protein